MKDETTSEKKNKDVRPSYFSMTEGGIISPEIKTTRELYMEEKPESEKEDNDGAT